MFKERKTATKLSMQEPRVELGTSWGSIFKDSRGDPEQGRRSASSICSLPAQLPPHPLQGGGFGARQGRSRAPMRVTEGSLPTRRDFGRKNRRLAPPDHATGSLGAGWYPIPGTHVPITCRSHTRRLHIKVWLGKSTTSHVALEETCTQNTRTRTSPQERQTEFCSTQGRELFLLGLAERCQSDTVVSPPRTKAQSRASYKPCQLQVQRLPSWNKWQWGEEHPVGRRASSWEPSSSCRVTQDMDHTLTGMVPAELVAPCASSWPPRLFRWQVSLPGQVTGVDTWRWDLIQEVSLSEATLKSRGVFFSRSLEVTGAAFLLCIMSVYFIARKGGNKYQTSPAFPPSRSTQENPSIPTKQMEAHAKPNRAHTDIVIFRNDTFNLIISEIKSSPNY